MNHQSSHPKELQTQETVTAYNKRGEPLTEANEATYPPAKDHRVFLNLYLKSLLLYFF